MRTSPLKERSCVGPTARRKLTLRSASAWLIFMTTARRMTSLTASSASLSGSMEDMRGSSGASAVQGQLIRKPIVLDYRQDSGLIRDTYSAVQSWYSPQIRRRRLDCTERRKTRAVPSTNSCRTTRYWSLPYLTKEGLRVDSGQTRSQFRN